MTVFNYTVNYADIIIAVAILLAVISGWRKGIFITVVYFLRCTACIALCWIADSKFSPIIYDTYVKPRAIDSINERIVTSKNLDVVIDNINKTVADMPKLFAKMIDSSSLKVSDDNISEAVLDSVFQPVLMVITRVLVFVAVIVLFYFVTTLIIWLIRRHQRRKDEEGKSHLRKADKLLGAVFGFAKGTMVVLLACSLLSVALQSAEQSNYTNAFFETLNASSLYKFISTINPFIQ